MLANDILVSHQRTPPPCPSLKGKGTIKRPCRKPQTRLPKRPISSAQHHEPERSRLFQGLRAIILESQEIVIPSTVASGHSAFPRLGLTDTALLEAVSAETPLLTVDHNLYTAALQKGEDAAVNFTAFRAL